MSHSNSRLNRRHLLQLGATGGAVAGGITTVPLLFGSAAQTPDPVSGDAHAGHPGMSDDNAGGHSASSTVGDIDVERLGIAPADFLRTFDYGTATTRSDGTVVREWEIVAFDREIEIAPGVYFPAWTYNGQVPGPTLRANEGDLLRIHFVNSGSHPHTLHFHGIHSAYHDGVTGIGRGII
jgi:FtsP/CotA-like multicopper oxidase with cupredoxin domain